MSTHRHFDAICVAVLIVTLFITLLFMNGEAMGIRVIVDEDSEAYSGETLQDFLSVLFGDCVLTCTDPKTGSIIPVEKTADSPSFSPSGVSLDALTTDLAPTESYSFSVDVTFKPVDNDIYESITKTYSVTIAPAVFTPGG